MSVLKEKKSYTCHSALPVSSKFPREKADFKMCHSFLSKPILEQSINNKRSDNKTTYQLCLTFTLYGPCSVIRWPIWCNTVYLTNYRLITHGIMYYPLEIFYTHKDLHIIRISSYKEIHVKDWDNETDQCCFVWGPGVNFSCCADKISLLNVFLVTFFDSCVLFACSSLVLYDSSLFGLIFFFLSVLSNASEGLYSHVIHLT